MNFVITFSDESFHSIANIMAAPASAINTEFAQVLAGLSPEAQAVILQAIINQRPKHKLKDPGPFDGKDISLFPQFEGKLRARLKSMAPLSVTRPNRSIMPSTF
jgi:hypothetical protein